MSHMISGYRLAALYVLLVILEDVLSSADASGAGVGVEKNGRKVRKNETRDIEFY